MLSKYLQVFPATFAWALCIVVFAVSGMKIPFIYGLMGVMCFALFMAELVEEITPKEEDDENHDQ